MNTPLDQAHNDSAVPSPHRQRVLLLAGLLALACLLCWSEWGALGSVQDTYAVAQRQLEQMRVDASRIEALRETPQSAAGRTRANEELLAQVERALRAAGIERGRWHDSIPQPPSRMAKTDYKRFTTRLYFDGVTLRQVAGFAHHLKSNDPTLQVSALTLTNRQLETPHFEVDLAVSYLVYAPDGGHMTAGGVAP